MIDGKSNKSTDNFLIAPTSIDGVVHKSAEHYYQYAKFDRSAGGSVLQHCAKIIQVENAGGAWGLGQSRAYKLIPNFEAEKVGLMYRGVRAKYHQHPELAKELLATSGPIQAANSTANWTRDNSLILERCREELRRLAGLTPRSEFLGVDWPSLVKMTGGPDAFTEADAAVPNCGGGCDQCQWAARRAVQRAQQASATTTGTKASRILEGVWAMAGAS